MQIRFLRRMTGPAAQQPAVFVQQRPQPPAAVAAAGVTDLMQRTVESRIPPAVEVQPVVVRKVVRMEPVPMLVDTAEVVVDTVLAVNNIEVNMVLFLELVQDTYWVLWEQWDTELIWDNRM